MSACSQVFVSTIWCWFYLTQIGNDWLPDGLNVRKWIDQINKKKHFLIFTFLDRTFPTTLFDFQFVGLHFKSGSALRRRDLAAAGAWPIGRGSERRPSPAGCARSWPWTGFGVALPPIPSCRPGSKQRWSDQRCGQHPKPDRAHAKSLHTWVKTQFHHRFFNWTQFSGPSRAVKRSIVALVLRPA